MDSPDASRGQWLRCPPCAAGLPHRREDCVGRMNGCTCRFCGHWREIIADARARPSDPLIRELLRIIEWRAVRDGQRRQYRRWQPTCQRPGCGNRVGNKTFGRSRLYCSPACKKAAGRARKRAREQAVRGQVVTDGPLRQSGGPAATGANWASTVPGPTREAMARRRAVEAAATFGLAADWLDGPQAAGDDQLA